MISIIMIGIQTILVFKQLKYRTPEFGQDLGTGPLVKVKGWGRAQQRHHSSV